MNINDVISAGNKLGFCKNEISRIDKKILAKEKEITELQKIRDEMAGAMQDIFDELTLKDS